MVVYDGSNCDIADSYTSVEYIKNIYSTDFFLNEDIISDISDDDLSNIIISATSVFDTLFIYKGEKTEGCRLQFPRLGQTDVPENVKKFIAHLIQDMLQRKDMFLKRENERIDLKRKKLAVMEKEYFNNYGKYTTIDAFSVIARKLIEPYIVDTTKTELKILKLEGR